MIEYKHKQYNDFEVGGLVVLVPLERYSYELALGHFKEAYEKMVQFDEHVTRAHPVRKTVVRHKHKCKQCPKDFFSLKVLKKHIDKYQ